MLLLILCLIAAASAGTATFIYNKDLLDDLFDYVMVSSFSLFACAVTLGAMLLISLVVGAAVPHRFTTERKDLIALQDGMQTQGAFFLGTGYVDGSPTYSYYVKDGTASRFEKADASTVRVFQDSPKPYLVQQTDCVSSAQWFVLCISDGRVTEIHVPKGTIKANYTLDAK